MILKKEKKLCISCPKEFILTKGKRDSHYTKCPSCYKRQLKSERLQLDFGINLAQYEDMLIDQLGVCAICKKRESSKGLKHLAVDHCHETGKVRGLLCMKCNTSLGGFQDNPLIVQAALNYILKN